MTAYGFRELPPLLHARRAPVAVALEDGSTLVVGANGWEWSDDRGWFETTDLPPERLVAGASEWRLASALVDGEGRLRGVQGVEWDAQQQRWTLLGRLPARPSTGTLKLPQGVELEVGGSRRGPEDPTSVAIVACELRRPDADPLRFALHRARIGATLTPLIDGRVLVSGGYDTATYVPDRARDNPVAETEVIDLVARTVSLGAALAKPRWGHAVALHPDGSLVIAGGSDAFLPGIAAAERGDPSATGTVRPFRPPG